MQRSCAHRWIQRRRSWTAQVRPPKNGPSPRLRVAPTRSSSAGDKRDCCVRRGFGVRVDPTKSDPMRIHLLSRRQETERAEWLICLILPNDSIAISLKRKVAKMKRRQGRQMMNFPCASATWRLGVKAQGSDETKRMDRPNMRPPAMYESVRPAPAQWPIFIFRGNYR